MVIDDDKRNEVAATLRSFRCRCPFDEQGDMDMLGDFLWDTLGRPAEPERGLHWTDDGIADMCEMLAALIER